VASSSTPEPAPYHDGYPLIGALLGLIDAERPELQLGRLETSLLNAGVVSSGQVVLLPEEVLTLIGNMGQKRARILRNYAKRTVLPLLGLVGAYEEPEILSPVNKGKEHAVGGDGATDSEDGLSWVGESPGDDVDDYGRNDESERESDDE